MNENIDILSDNWNHSKVFFGLECLIVGGIAATQISELVEASNLSGKSFVQSLRDTSALNKASLGLCFAWGALQLGSLIAASTKKPEYKSNGYSSSPDVRRTLNNQVLSIF